MASTPDIDAAGREYERDLHMNVSVQVNAAQQRPAGNAPPLVRQA